MTGRVSESFFDYFDRPGQHFDPAAYSNRLSASVGYSVDNEAKKYQSLFADTFGHHVQFNLDTSSDITIQPNDTRRFVTSDSLTSYFLDILYTPPNMYETPNTTFREDDKITFQQFLASISDTPVTRQNFSGDAIGSNRISYIIGDVGSGKTLLLCKVVRELMRIQRKKLSRGEENLLIPVYFDFETEMRSDDGRLSDIDDKFYGKLCNAILKYLEFFSTFRSRMSGIVDVTQRSFPNDITRLMALIRYLHKQNIISLLILDNIDGYHYHYSKYSFFPKYYKQQSYSIKKNILDLSSILSQGDHLGLMGISVVLAARRYVYEDCMHSSAPESSSEYSGSIFQLEEVSEDKVVSTRLELFEAAIQKIEDSPKLKKVGEDYKKTLARLSVLFGLQRATSSNTEYYTEERSPVMKTLRKLCHHGNRNLVTFLANLRLDYREDGALIERFFWDKPHTLVVLYLANLRERYSQKQGHFPNLFLVDAMILRDPNFPLAYQPHQHTYWLKYLILAFVSSQPDSIARISQLHRFFVKVGGYDENLFYLTLGSLCTTRESRCLEPEPEPGERTMYSKVIATPRGKFLVSKWDASSDLFCFSFTYLQLVVDDFLMSYPKDVCNEVYNKDINLSYLFSDPKTYGSQNRVYLLSKMHCVLAFMHVLKVSYEIENSNKSVLFEKITKHAPCILPNFNTLLASLFAQYKKIFSTFTDAETILKDAKEYWDKLEKRIDVRNQLKFYFNSNIKVEE